MNFSSQINNMKIINVIVAFENIVDIKNLLNRISKQDLKCITIICIDNSFKNSIEIKDVFNKYAIENKAKVFYLKTSKNEGSAKGFAIGMQKAHALGADWIWLHDQDGYPKDNCLACLNNSSENSHILVPCVVGEDNKRIKVFSALINEKDNWTPVEIQNSETEIHIAGTAGLLINKVIIDKIGVYDYEHFFVGMEDFDFCIRARESKFNLKLIKDAEYFHPNKWEITEWEIKKALKFFGECNKTESRIKGGYIYYNIIHTHHFFIPSLIYSVAKVFLRSIYFKNVDLMESLNIYYSGIKDKKKRKKKIEIDISNLVWTLFDYEPKI